jgi:glycyl-tRNA synthetase
MAEDLMTKIVSLCKRRGFIFQSSEVYGGLQSCWDYGPLGVELKNNVKRLWWNAVVKERDDVAGMDTSIIMHPKIWEASGHVQNFNDPMVDCKKCKQRFRADGVSGDKCPECGGELTDARQFNLMFKTFMGPVEDANAAVYLRPETCQSIFVNFQNVVNATRLRIPFGIAQIGKSFRNEITPRNFTFRSREFEQMELEYFVRDEESAKWFEYWVAERQKWYAAMGIRSETLRLREHGKDELAFYAKRCIDIEFKFPFLDGGYGELEGIADRGTYDLSQQMKFSGADLQYLDKEKNERFTPAVVESSGGVDRTILALICDAYHEEEVAGETRAVLRFRPKVAPIKIAVLPLSKKPELCEPARAIERMLRPHYETFYDETQSIGKRYRRMDEVGTPYAVTFDFDSIQDRQVTVRERDSLKQVRLPIDNLTKFFEDLFRRGSWE